MVRVVELVRVGVTVNRMYRRDEQRGLAGRAGVE